MTDYRDHGKTGGPGSAAITNDDEQLLDIPDLVEDWEYDYAKQKADRSY